MKKQACNILRIDAVLARSGAKSKSTIYGWIEAGLFPKPIRTGPHSSGWLESEIATWQAARKAERDAKELA